MWVTVSTFNMIERKQMISDSAEWLAGLCLENSDKPQGYSDRDLVNACHIFSHFLMDVTFAQCKSYPQQAQLDLAQATGEAVRELIRAATGKDTHQLIKQVYEPKSTS